MRNDDRKKTVSKPSSSPKQRKQSDEGSQFETMSQQQNRHGKGRQHNGSDGSPNGGRGSNH
jgi:hypothetical protein